jgi:hypothetical protein
VPPERMVSLCLAMASLQLGCHLRPTGVAGANGRPT